MKKLLCKIDIHIGKQSFYIGSSWSLGQFRCTCPNCGKTWIELRQMGKENILDRFDTMWMICFVLIAIILYARLF